MIKTVEIDGLIYELNYNKKNATTYNNKTDKCETITFSNFLVMLRKEHEQIEVEIKENFEKLEVLQMELREKGNYNSFKIQTLEIKDADLCGYEEELCFLIEMVEKTI